MVFALAAFLHVVDPTGVQIEEDEEAADLTPSAVALDASRSAV